ncbi:glycerol dehydrogenase [compost metagenome]
MGFCLIVQSILEGRDDVGSIIAVLRKYELPVTLAELGITGQTDDKIRRVSEDTLLIQPDGGFAFPADSASLAEAIRAADRAGREALSLPAAAQRLPFPFYYPY